MTGSLELRELLEQAVGPSHVHSRVPAARRSTSHPAFLLEPSSASEVAEVVRIAGRRDATVIPVGTAMRDSEDEPDPERPRVFIDMRRLCHVLRLDETSLVVHVQAGLTALELEEILGKRGLSLGDYPPASLGSTIGGALAVRTPGKLSRRHGFIEDNVLGLSAVLADGRTVHTRVSPRRASGPDLARALCGSEGTLGIITSAVLRIHRIPEARFVASYALPSFDDAVSAVQLALREEALPAAVRVYDRAGATLHFGEAVGDAQALLLMATAGPTDLAACDRDLVASAVTAVGGEAVSDELAETWWDARTGRGTVLEPPHLQVSATPSQQRAVYAAALEAAAESQITLAVHASRFDLDGGILFFTLLDDVHRPLPAGERAAISPRILEECSRAGAHLLGAEDTDLAPYLQTLRAQLDPNGILNPGALAPSPTPARRPEPTGAA